MEYTINEFREEVLHQVYEVYRIFQDFFGEEYTDLQDLPSDARILSTFEDYGITESEQGGVYTGEDSRWEGAKSALSNWVCYILVWWPHVTVTNEHDKSVDIHDLYAKVKVTREGTIPYEYRGFELTRTTFSKIQYSEGYIHSHTPRFHRYPPFEDPCLGTGPIRRTILDLKSNNEEALWMLFCHELSRYVTVESLAGGPYIRLESLGKGNRCSDYRGYERDIRSIEDMEETISWGILKPFIKYYLENGHLVFNYIDNQFQPGIPYHEFIIDISNAFIDFCNHHLNIPDAQKRSIANKVLRSVKVANCSFYTTSNGDNELRYEGTYLLTFKGEEKCLHILNTEESSEMALVLNNSIALSILNRILKVINFRYGNNQPQLGTCTAGQTNTAPTGKTVYYL